MTRVGTEKPSATAGPQLLNSKSVPTLHHIGKPLNQPNEHFELVLISRCVQLCQAMREINHEASTT